MPKKQLQRIQICRIVCDGIGLLAIKHCVHVVTSIHSIRRNVPCNKVDTDPTSHPSNNVCASIGAGVEVALRWLPYARIGQENARYSVCLFVCLLLLYGGYHPLTETKGPAETASLLSPVTGNKKAQQTVIPSQSPTWSIS